MAIIKMVKNKSKTIAGLKKVLEYVTNPVKTVGTLVSSFNCVAESAFEEMKTIKNEFHQNSGRQYIHLIQSFDVKDDIDPTTANEIGQKLISNYPNFQAVIATHTDRKHIHNHIVINTVDIETGRKWQQSKNDLQQLKQYSDDLCTDYGLHTIIRGNSGFKDYGEYKIFNERTGSWKHMLASTVSSCAKVADSRADFIHRMAEHDIEIDFGDTNVMFTMPNGKKCSNKKIMSYGDFSTKNLNDWFKINSNFNAFRDFEPDFLDVTLRTLSDAWYGDPMAIFTMCLVTIAVGVKMIMDRKEHWDYNHGNYKANELYNKREEEEWEL